MESLQNVTPAEPEASAATPRASDVGARGCARAFRRAGVFVGAVSVLLTAVAPEAARAQPAWAETLFARLLSSPYPQSALPAGVRLIGINPFIPADGTPAALVNVSLRSTHASYDLLYDMQVRGGRWRSSVMWGALRKNANLHGSLVFHPTAIGFGAVCSYADLGRVGLDITCSAYVRGVLVHVAPPAPVASAQTNEVVSILRSGVAHLRRIRG
jgi:hypothetical protein